MKQLLALPHMHLFSATQTLTTLLLVSLCGLPAAAAAAAAGTPEPGQPKAVHRVQPNPSTDELQAALDLAQPGDVIVLSPGVYEGNWCIDIPVTIKGSGDGEAVLEGRGVGNVLTVTAPDVVLRGFKVQGGGTNLRGPDCGVYTTPHAERAVIDGLTFEYCTFGVWIHETRFVELVNNRVYGSQEGVPSQRGNGIQLFDASELIVRNNYVTGGRDGIYVSAVEESLIQGNLTENLRYGVHYMYSYNNRLINNAGRNNLIGFALMQSRYLTVTGNRAEGNERHALLFRDAQYCTIQNNVLLNNGEGLFFFSSTDNRIIGNTVAGNAVGAKIWAGSYDNEVSGNRFLGNARQIFYVGATDLEWGGDGAGNLWSDYVGWDQNGDGLGDRPYRVDNFTGRLVYRYPASGALVHSPAFELLTWLEKALPLFKVPTVVDHSPMLTAKMEDAHD